MAEKNNTVNALARLLADTYTLYLKTHNYHWNVKGPRFRELHLLFQEQYNELWLAVDEIAERIRTLGYSAPGSYSQFAKLTSLKEAADTPPAAEDMIRDLAAGHAQVARTAQQLLKAAQEGDDEVSVDLSIQRQTIHEKTAWMLSSSVETKADPLASAT